jgi:hypothetical protein
VLGEFESNEGQPIQPRNSVDISLDGHTPHGIFFEGGRDRLLVNFDPVITRIITDDTNIPLWQTEPTFENADSWQPADFSLLNRLNFGAVKSENLVVIPAQYQSIDKTTGRERLFDEMDFTVYYSETNDFVPPNIWVVSGTVSTENQLNISVEATDLSDVQRVAATYTLQDGIWLSVDLVRDSADPDLWHGVIPSDDNMLWLIQAVDGAGNVVSYHNRGHYFSVHSLTPLAIMLSTQDASIWSHQSLLLWVILLLLLTIWLCRPPWVCLMMRFPSLYTSN